MIDFQPYKLSPVHHSLEKLGARWTELDGWRTAVRFHDPEQQWQAITSHVGLSDLSFQGKVEFRGSQPDLEAGLPHLLTLQSLPPVGGGAKAAQGVTYRTTHEEVLFSAPTEAKIAPFLTLQNGEQCLSATDRTHGFAQFLIAGPRARGLLQRLTDLDVRDSIFPDLSCRRAPLAGVNTLIVRRDRKQLRAFELFVGREYGDYTWAAIWETGKRLGMTACGHDVYRRLEE